MPISGLNNVNDALLFHSGTKLLNSKLVSNGGRVLNVVSINKTLESAINHAYQDICYPTNFKYENNNYKSK